MKKGLEKIILDCQKNQKSKGCIAPMLSYCDKVYSSQDKICKYNGEAIQVPIYKEGIRGYALRYSCILYSKVVKAI